MNPDNQGLSTFLKRIDATKSNLAILPVQARSAQEIDKAFAAMSRERIEMFINRNTAKALGWAICENATSISHQGTSA